jgi:hypothetical protein
MLDFCWLPMKVKFDNLILLLLWHCKTLEFHTCIKLVTSDEANVMQNHMVYSQAVTLNPTLLSRQACQSDFISFKGTRSWGLQVEKYSKTHYTPKKKSWTAVLLSNQKRLRILPLWTRHARLYLIKVQLKIRWIYSLCWRLPTYANMLIFCTQNNIWDSSAAMRKEGYLIVVHKHFVGSQICFNHWHLNEHGRFNL